MDINIQNVTPIKVLTEWPLSRVELVEIQSHPYILKSVHPDFSQEASRQQFLSQTLKAPLSVPAVYEVFDDASETKFLMEYIEGDEPSTKEALHAIELFHKQTRNITSPECFPRYSHEEFLRDRSKVSDLISGISLDNFEEVFTSQTSIVHGDWKHSQLIKCNETYYIFDFGRSFWGPSILDYGYYFKDDAEGGLEYFSTNKTLLLKAKLVALIMQLEWFVRCRENYISYDYNKEISETQSKMEAVTALLNKEESTLC